jgi:hypothetical protein
LSHNSRTQEQMGNQTNVVFSISFINMESAFLLKVVEDGSNLQIWTRLQQQEYHLLSANHYDCKQVIIQIEGA